MVVSGHRESEHPIQRISGFWPTASEAIRSGSSLLVFAAHSLFWLRAVVNRSVLVVVLAQDRRVVVDRCGGGGDGVWDDGM